VGTAFAQQANVNLDYDPQKNTENLVPFSAPLNSPDVRDDRTVVLRLKAPEAHRVSLAGVAILTGLGRSKPVPFVKGDDGSWSLTIGPMKPDMYAFSERRRRRWPIDYRSASRRSRAGAIAAVQIS
jgi:enterochelin esterase family protein